MDRLKGSEYGFLLLTSNLGDPERKPLTVAQFRELTNRSELMKGRDKSRDVSVSDFVSVGYSQHMARHIVELLQDELLMAWYLDRAKKEHILPITRATEAYPTILRQRLGLDSPGCLWARGDLSLLDQPAISLVGSRDLNEPNQEFAAAVGRQAARQGLVLVSGNARGADKTAQNACLDTGGKVISIVADSLLEHPPRKNVLYLSEGSFDEPFSAQRALSRNRCIHALGQLVFVAQTEHGKGGTWDGTAKNLHFGWSPVVCFRDGSEGSRQLEQMGAYLIDLADLSDFSGLRQEEITFF